MSDEKKIVSASPKVRKLEESLGQIYIKYKVLKEKEEFRKKM